MSRVVRIAPVWQIGWQMGNGRSSPLILDGTARVWRIATPRKFPRRPVRLAPRLPRCGGQEGGVEAGVGAGGGAALGGGVGQREVAGTQDDRFCFGFVREHAGLRSFPTCALARPHAPTAAATS